jgi:hypothetical protein
MRVTGLLILDDHAVFLGVGDAKPLVREWCDESSVRGKFLGLVEKRVPTHAEWHICINDAGSTKLRG